MRYCTNCGKQIADNDLFCSRCGTATSIKKCKFCDKIIGADDIFCKYCGKDQSKPLDSETEKDASEANTDNAVQDSGSGAEVVSADAIPNSAAPSANAANNSSQQYCAQQNYRQPVYPQPFYPLPPLAPYPYAPNNNTAPVAAMPYPPAKYSPMVYPPMVYPPMAYQYPPKKRLFKKGVLPLFIWSLILVVLINPVGTVLSAISTFFLLSANTDKEDYEADIKKKKALVLNIASSAFDVITITVLIVLAVTMK